MKELYLELKIINTVVLQIILEKKVCEMKFVFSVF